MKVLENNVNVQSVLEEIAASLPAIRKVKREGVMVEEPSKNRKYNEKQFKNLIAAILTDKDYVTSDKFQDITKKFIKNPQKKLGSFLSKLLRHAGIKSDDERQAIIDTFEASVKDFDFVFEAVDEAMEQYLRAEKTVRFMADKPMTLSLSIHEVEGKPATIRRKVKRNK